MKTLTCDLCEFKASGETFEEWINNLKPHYMEKHAEFMKQQSELPKEEQASEMQKWERENRARFDARPDDKQMGFAVSITLIAISVAVVVTGGVGYIFKEEIGAALRGGEPEEQEDVVPTNLPPFPTREPGPPGEPREPSTDVGEQGQPITTPNITATGEWHGNYTPSAPAPCAGVAGGWEAFITEDGGVVTGQFSADAGFGGPVSGTRSGTTTTWNVGGSGQGVSFRGDISGNTVSGTFTGPDCPLGGGRTSGTFFGGRIVP